MTFLEKHHLSPAPRTGMRKGAPIVMTADNRVRLAKPDEPAHGVIARLQCGNCGEEEGDHAPGEKCLFVSTTFEPDNSSKAYVWLYDAYLNQRVGCPTGRKERP